MKLQVFFIMLLFVPLVLAANETNATTTETGGGSFLCFAGFKGWDCSLNFLIMIVLFFLAAIARRQVVDLLNMQFNLIGATAAMVIAYILIAFITHSLKWSFLGGIVGLLIGGFALASFLPDFGGEGNG